MDKFVKYYEDPGSRPIFETVDEMLQWAGLYNLTTRTLRDELVDAGLSTSLINELVTVRILSTLSNVDHKFTINVLAILLSALMAIFCLSLLPAM